MNSRSAAAIGLAILAFAVFVRFPTLTRSAALNTSNATLPQLLNLRYETARRLLESEQIRMQEGRSTLPTVCEAARRVRDSAIELPLSTAQRLMALTNYVNLTRRLEENVTQVVEKGVAPPSDQDLASYLRLDAEIALLRLQSQSPTP